MVVSLKKTATVARIRPPAPWWTMWTTPPHLATIVGLSGGKTNGQVPMAMHYLTLTSRPKTAGSWNWSSLTPSPRSCSGPTQVPQSRCWLPRVRAKALSTRPISSRSLPQPPRKFTGPATCRDSGLTPLATCGRTGPLPAIPPRTANSNWGWTP